MITIPRHALRSLSTSGLSTPTSTVYRGTAFERRAKNILENHLSMSLRNVGGKSDGGVDLLGWWWLPPSGACDINMPRRRLRVFAQCKAEKKKIGPKFIREMEGVLHRYLSLSTPSDPSDPCNSKIHASSVTQVPRYPLVALFISESPYTRSAMLQAQSSPVPLFLLHIPPEPSILDLSSLEGSYNEWVGSAAWNPALASTQGILGGEIDIRWEWDVRGSGRPGLWWRNQKLANWTPEMDEMKMRNPDPEYGNVSLEKNV